MNAINEEPEHREIESLLPWYAAGTLSRRDANRVEQALAGDRELARQYDLVREELVLRVIFEPFARWLTADQGE
jgi:anti-sigma-K factor RskA